MNGHFLPTLEEQPPLSYTKFFCLDYVNITLVKIKIKIRRVKRLSVHVY